MAKKQAKPNWKKLYEKAMKDSSYYEQRYNEIYSKLSTTERKLNEVLDTERRETLHRTHEAVHQADVLLEIIRWQINPKTTAYPFSAHRDQKEGGDNMGTREGRRYPISMR